AGERVVDDRALGPHIDERSWEPGFWAGAHAGGRRVDHMAASRGSSGVAAQVTLIYRCDVSLRYI
ncbi:MAG: hypothetical protein ACRDTZ_24740, partial [Pseudonocardiaceae bacterium]